MTSPSGRERPSLPKILPTGGMVLTDQSTMGTLAPGAALIFIGFVAEPQLRE